MTKLDIINNLKQQAIQEAEAVWSEGGYKANFINFYYFPKEKFLIVALELIPPDNLWECDHCPGYFWGKPECDPEDGLCNAEKSSSFVVTFEIDENDLGERNHHHKEDFESEYVSKNDCLSNYEINTQDLLRLLE